MTSYRVQHPAAATQDVPEGITVEVLFGPDPPEVGAFRTPTTPQRVQTRLTVRSGSRASRATAILIQPALVLLTAVPSVIQRLTNTMGFSVLPSPAPSPSTLLLRSVVATAATTAFIALLAWASYVLWAHALNSTRIIAGDGILTVTHGILPWPGKVRVRAAELGPVVAEESNWASARWSRGGRHTVFAVTPSGDRLVLVRRLVSAEQAAFIQRALERWRLEASG